MAFKWFFIFILIVALILAGIGLYFYFGNEKKIEDTKISYDYINIMANEKNNKVSTGYYLYLNSLVTPYANGTTLDNGFIMNKVPMNNSIYIRNFNINNQTYYTDLKKTDTFDMSPKRIYLNLVKPGELVIGRKNELDDNCSINLTIVFKGEYRNSKFCVKYGIHIIKIIINKNEVSKDLRYSGYDKCYDLGTFKEGDLTNIQINCMKYGDISQADYINLAFFDKDIYEGTENKEWDNPTYYEIKGINQ